MAKVKVINNNLDQNLNGTFFNNTASETIFSFGRFSVTSNFDSRKYIDYSNTLSSFIRTVTLETMGITETQSKILEFRTTNAVLNLDKSDLNTFIRFGSAYEFLRVTIEKIITSYPGSLFMNSQVVQGGNRTLNDYEYDAASNTSTFTIPYNANPKTNCIINTFGLVYNYGNTSIPDDRELKNLNLSHSNYIVWSTQAPELNDCKVLGYTGNTSGNPWLTLKVQGNPFPFITGGSGTIDFHIRPNIFIFEEFRALLSDYEKYIVSDRNGTNGFKFTLKDPVLLDDGNIEYTDSELQWSTGDKYNIDVNTPSYQRFLEILLTIGAKYDKIKTDLIARFLTPASIKQYDLTEEGKMTKLLRIYGMEFDQLREFIDSLVHINKVTYNKANNIPDQLIMNMSRTFGWDYFSLVNENELVDSFLTIDENERNLNTDLLPAEIDVELWRRILMNTNYFWKSKGTREAIKSMFLLIGIPEPFINITEYVYTVDGRINPNTVSLEQEDFPTNSLPYDNSGYPVAPLETPNFYFQISGDTDGGQAYMNVFRSAGFNLIQTVDNKKSWVDAGAITRIDSTTPQYYQEDSRLVLNTKEVDVALDTARGIEYDVYDYVESDFEINSSGYTLPFSYVNISLDFTGTQGTFPLPSEYLSNKVSGDLEIRYNGILLNAPKTGDTGGTGVDLSEADYIIDEVTKTFTLTGQTGAMYAVNSGYRRDVVQATFVYSGGTHSITGISVNYVVTRVQSVNNGTYIHLPTMPRGDIQVTINGIALTKGTSQFSADYIVDPNNTTGSSGIIIQNSEVISFLQRFPNVQVAYVEVDGSNDIAARSEILRVDSFNSSKIYFSHSANKFVYKLNYKANNASDLKVLIDGIALEPNRDYSVNSQNPYEIFLPSGIKYGTVISIYYLVGGNALFNPVVNNDFGVGDISQLSFLEFIELIQRRLINVRNRKTITDFKGGWYPTLLNVYTQYLKRASLETDNPLLSNGYTFENLYSFLSKYNTFFQRFTDQLLSATIILKKSGILIRNTVFSKQKFAYKRGVNLYAQNSTTTDMRGNLMLQYLGDAGSVFKIALDDAPPDLCVETIAGIGCYNTSGTGLGSIQNTGGMSVLNYNLITDYGVEYKCSTSSAWLCQPNPLCSDMLTTDTYPATICGLTEGSTYQYRAVVKSDTLVAYGQTCSIAIPVKPIDPVIINPTAYTCTGMFNMEQISSTGGYVLPAGIGSGVTIYGMQYSAGTTYVCPTFVPTVNTTAVVSCTTTSLSLSQNKMVDDGLLPIHEYGVLYTQMLTQKDCLLYENLVNVCKVCVVGDIPNDTFYASTLSGLTSGTNTYYRAYAKNQTGVGYGQMGQTYTCSTASPVSIWNIVGGTSGQDGIDLDVCRCGCLNSTLTAGQSFNATFDWRLSKQSTSIVVPVCYKVIRYIGATCAELNSCTISSKDLVCNCFGTFTIPVAHGQCIHVVTHACTTSGSGQSQACVYLQSVSGSFTVGSPQLQISYTCSYSGGGGGGSIIDDGGDGIIDGGGGVITEEESISEIV